MKLWHILVNINNMTVWKEKRSDVSESGVFCANVVINEFEADDYIKEMITKGWKEKTMSKPNFKCTECEHEFYSYIYDMVDDSCPKCGKASVVLIDVLNKRIEAEKEYLRTMMAVFDASIIEEQSNFIQFRLGTYSKAMRFTSFLGDKGFRKSGIIGDKRDWRIVVWF